MNQKQTEHILEFDKVKEQWKELALTTWAKEEIDIAVTNKVCIGTSDYTFSPDKYITREEAASMIANYLKLSEIMFLKSMLY